MLIYSLKANLIKRWTKREWQEIFWRKTRFSKTWIRTKRGDKVNGKYERRWHPYDCRQQFRITRRNIFPRISTLAQIKNNLVGSFSDRLHVMERKWRFSSDKDFMNHLDEIVKRYTSWKEGSFKSDISNGSKKVHRMWYKDTLAILQEILSDVMFRDEIV